jgi:hypothetical protein
MAPTKNQKGTTRVAKEEKEKRKEMDVYEVSTCVVRESQMWLQRNETIDTIRTLSNVWNYGSSVW